MGHITNAQGHSVYDGNLPKRTEQDFRGEIAHLKGLSPLEKSVSPMVLYVLLIASWEEWHDIFKTLDVRSRIQALSDMWKITEADRGKYSGRIWMACYLFQQYKNEVYMHASKELVTRLLKVCE